MTCASTRRRRRRLERGEQGAAVVRVQRPGVVEGKVLGPDGEPLAGVRVTLRNYDVATGQQTDGGNANVPTDREGRYRFLGALPGGHRVDTDGERDWQASSEVFEVGAGETVKRDLRVEK